MKTILDDEDEVPPLDPKKVALFGILLGMIVLAGWRFWRAHSAVKAVAEASTDYRKLFPSRSEETAPAPVPLPKPVVTAEAPASGIGLLKIDDDMRAPRRVPQADAPAPPPPEAPPSAATAVEASALAPAAAPAAPAAPVKKAFNQPRLNSGAFSGLNGGAGISFSGTPVGGGAKAAAPAAPAAPGAPALPNIPGMPSIPGLPTNTGTAVEKK